MKLRNTFCKAERLNSKLIIDKLFAGGNSSIAAFPLRVVFMQMEKTSVTDGCVPQPPVSILISVPKKRFHHAVDRNRLKRLVRESYRKHKHVLWDALSDKDYVMVMAFVCITDVMPDYRHTEKSVVKILSRIAEKVS